LLRHYRSIIFSLGAPSTVLLFKQTSTAANSWATVSLWRRFFEQRELEEEEQLAIIADTFVDLHYENDDGDENLSPVEAEEARQARINFVRDCYRNLRNSSTSHRDPVVDRLEIASAGAIAAQQERRQVNRPNLEIPVGQEYVYRAQ
jgi:hypothetical protein